MYRVRVKNGKRANSQFLFRFKCKLVWQRRNDTASKIRHTARKGTEEMASAEKANGQEMSKGEKRMRQKQSKSAEASMNELQCS